MQEFEFQKPAEMNNAPLFVSLYIVLLAFFILLVSISHIDYERAKQTVESVASSFSKSASPENETPRPEAVPDANAGLSFDTLLGTIIETVPLEEIKMERDEDHLRVIIPAASLFEVRDIIVRSDRADFIPKLARAMLERGNGMRAEIEILSGMAEENGDTLSPEAYLEIDRSGAMARQLVQDGVAGDAVTIGIGEEYPGNIVFNFYLRPIPSDTTGRSTP